MSNHDGGGIEQEGEGVRLQSDGGRGHEEGAVGGDAQLGYAGLLRHRGVGVNRRRRVRHGDGGAVDDVDPGDAIVGVIAETEIVDRPVVTYETPGFSENICKGYVKASGSV